MLTSLKRLFLGVVLIAGASTVLLLSDAGSRTKPAAGPGAPASPSGPERTVRVALLQHASQAILDDGRDGMIAGLAERGWVAGRNLDIKYYNAQGDIPVAQAIAREMTAGHYDLLLTISTVSFQAVANANKVGRTPHVFGLVTDPYVAGVGLTRGRPLEHPPYLAGYGTMQPIAEAFALARRMNPSLASVGVVWNAAEANSEAQVKLARKVCAGMGIKLLESTVDNSSGVAEAASALVARGVDALWLDGDVTVSTASASLVGAARKGRIPVFSVLPPQVRAGTLFDLGADYHEVGRLAGLLAGDVLKGRSPATVPIENVLPEMLTLNRRALAGLKASWKIPAGMAERADLVIDERGTEHARSAPRAAALPPIGSPVPGRTYRIGFAYFAPEPSLESCQRGLLDGLKALGFVEGKNLAVSRSHAQGEMVNILPIIQTFDSSDLDVIVPFSTPVLQGALASAKHKPIVFTYITDPLAAGAGKTYTDHNPRVTGIGSLPPIEDTVQIIRRVMPKVKNLGTLYNSGEANSVKIVSLLRESAKHAGLNLIELTAASSNEVYQAMQALVARGIDAFYLPSDNTAYLAYDAIRKVTEAANIPLIIDDPDFLGRGAVLVCGPGFYDSGKAAAPLLARVLLGESPARIPMANVSVNTTKFNPAVVKRLGLSISAETIREIEAGGTVAAPAFAPGGASARRPAAAGRNPSGKKWKIALVLYNEAPPAEETIAGMKRMWARSALVEGRDYEIKLRSAQGDIAALNGILDAALTDGADIIVPMSTPTLQAALQRVKHVPIVFTLIGDPVSAGAGRSFTDHRPNVTGVAVLAPLADALDLVQKHFPAYKRLGTLFCPAESNSVYMKDLLVAACRERGLTLETVAANTSGELPDAALALMSRPIDAVLQITDNLTAGGFTAIARAARQSKKPLLSLNATTLRLGAAVALGRDYGSGGEATIGLLERVIRGESPGTIPFILAPKIDYLTSAENARAVGMELPDSLLREFAKRSEASAQPAEAPSGAKAGTSSASPNPSGKKWKIALILYNDTPPGDEIQAGMKAAWKRSRLVEGRDYEITLRNAQGDLALLNGIFDAALTDRADLVVTLSTPTLQAAVRKIHRAPVVFTLVTDPMAAGAGKSYTDHLPNVTGVSVLAPVAEALDLIQKHYPQYKRLGTLYCPAEANALFLKEALEKLCRERGLTLEAVAANNSSELSDAALSLCSRPIDAILQIPDALSSAGFSAIAKAARRARMPLFALNSTVVAHGAAVGLGRDFRDAGAATVAVIERVIAGESPASIPFSLPPKISSAASPANARALGMVLPPALLQEMGKVIP